jgi:hypothetical protein
LAVISSEELTEWAAYFELDPFGSYRSDLQAALVSSTIANVHATKGHRFSPKDFMLRFQSDPEPASVMSGAAVLAMFRAIDGGAHG